MPRKSSSIPDMAKGQITAGVFGLDGQRHDFLISQEHTRKDTEGLHPLKWAGLLCEVHSRPGRGEEVSVHPPALRQFHVCLSFSVMA